MENPEIDKILATLKELIQSGTVSKKKDIRPERAAPLDMDSRRIFLRVSDSAHDLFTQEAEWLRDSGFRVGERKPKAQVLLHILIHEWAKLTDAEKRKICSAYLD